MDFLAPILVIILIGLFFSLFFSYVPLRLWIAASASGVKIGILQLVGMRVRKVVPSRIVNPLIKASPFPSISWKPIIWPAATWIGWSTP